MLALAVLVVGDAVVLGQRLDQLRDPVAETLTQLFGAHVGVLDHVVEQRGGDHLVAEAGSSSSPATVSGMGDVRRPVVLAALARMRVAGNSVRVGDELGVGAGAPARGLRSSSPRPSSADY